MSWTALRMGMTTVLAGTALVSLTGFGVTAASASAAPARHTGSPKVQPNGCPAPVGSRCTSNVICTYRLLGNTGFDTGTAVYQLYGGDEVSGYPQIKDTDKWYMYSFRIGQSGWIVWQILQEEYCNPT